MGRVAQILRVAEALRSGQGRPEILDLAAREWGASRATTDRLLALARTLPSTPAAPPDAKAGLLQDALQSTAAIREAAMGAQRLDVALAAQVELNRLRGL